MDLSQKQIESLAPDAASLKSGRALGQSSHWSHIGQNLQALWGECQGSGKNPYRTQIALGDLGSKCTCPSRKFPCKHALGLMMLSLKFSLPISEPPEWVAVWLDGRKKRDGPTETAPGEHVSQKRQDARHRKVLAGLHELDLWLNDLIEGGFGQPQIAKREFWEHMRARMIDAQMPGLAKQLVKAAETVGVGDHWIEALLYRLGRIHLVKQGYFHLDAFSEPEQADIKVAIGYPQETKHLKEHDEIQDTFVVLGQRVEESGDRLYTRRVWLWAVGKGQNIALVDFAFQKPIFEGSYATGDALKGTMQMFASAFPWRGTWKHLPEKVDPIIPTGLSGFEEALAVYSRALGRNPFLEHFGWVVCLVRPSLEQSHLVFTDQYGKRIPISPSQDPWLILALSGGHPVTLAGEYDGEMFVPIGLWINQSVYDLSGKTT
ncbi:MAG: SWIM zinc finger family protein [Deinococcaceae bacterium]